MNRRINFKAAHHLAGLITVLVLGLQPVAAQSTPPELNSGADSDYCLGPEDVIQVWVWKEPDLSTIAVVRPDGKLSLPLIGELNAKGKNALQLESEVKKKLLIYLEEPVVTVIVKEINYPKVAVLGKVHKPDVYKIRQKTTVLDAIAMAGGFTDYAKRDKVLVIRNNSSHQQRIDVDLKHPGGDTELIYLQPSDTVYVQ